MSGTVTQRWIVRYGFRGDTRTHTTELDLTLDGALHVYNTVAALPNIAHASVWQQTLLKSHPPPADTET